MTLIVVFASFAPGLIGIFRWISQQFEKLCGLANKESPARQEVDNSHGNPLCLGWADD